jgi:hypothetical protein
MKDPPGDLTDRASTRYCSRMPPPGAPTTGRRCLLCHQTLPTRPQPPTFALGEMTLRDAWRAIQRAVMYMFWYGVVFGLIAGAAQLPAWLGGPAVEIAGWMKIGFLVLFAAGMACVLEHVLHSTGLAFVELGDAWARAGWFKRITTLIVLTAVYFGVTNAPGFTAIVSLLFLSVAQPIHEWRQEKRWDWEAERKADRRAAEWPTGEDAPPGPPDGSLG